MGIDDLKQQFYAKLEAGEFGKSAAGAKTARVVSQPMKPLDLRSKAGAANLLARSVGQKPKIQKPTAPAKPDLVALTEAANTWAHKSTNGDLDSADRTIEDKLRVVREFFRYIDKDLIEVTPPDVTRWLGWLKRSCGLKANTIYTYCSHLCGFFDWIIGQPRLGEFFIANPVRPAFVKKPKAYQSRLSRALDDADLKSLWEEMERVRSGGGAAGLRDYSLFVFFAATGGRRDEITKLRGNDIKIQNGIVTYYPRTKGGKRAGKVVDNPLVGQALLDYLAASNRKPEQVFGRDVPLWMPHDIGRAGRLKRKKKEAEQAAEQALAVRGSSRPKPEKQSGLTSHSFARLMKAYAARAGIYDFNLHKIRHTFARIVHEDTQSLPETQNALGHRSPDTTRIYVPNITIESNTHGTRLQNRIGL